MIRNYLTTALRNLVRYRSYSFLNIFGLTVGLVTSIFIFLWVVDEMSFDRFHKKSDRIFRVMINNTYPDGTIETHGATPEKLAEALRQELPEVDQITQLSWDTEMLIAVNDKSFKERGIYASPEFFSTFSFPIVTGNSNKPLPNEKSVSISASLGKKFFGTENPIGKTLQVNHVYDLTVTSVFEDVPTNSTLQFDYVIAFELWRTENPWSQNWVSGGMQTVITLKPEADVATASKKISNLIKKNCPPCTTSPFLFPFSKLHLYDQFENGKNAGGRIAQLVLFSVVAAIILIMACINFMNLATARAATRSREIGVRKSIGARQSGLIVQFILESVLLSFIALLFALVCVQLLLPFFNEVTEKTIFLNFRDPLFISGILSITLVCGLLAGSYPAFFLSSFKPVAVLKGNVQSSLTGSGIRKTLVVVQFMTSMILVAGSLVVYHQIKFISNKNLGFQKDNIITINQNEGLLKHHAAFKNDLMQFPTVKGVGFGGSNIFRVPITTTDPKWEGKPENSSIIFKIFRCDQGFIPTMGIELLAGRNFTDIDQADASNYIVNKKAMEVMGLTPENVIGTDLEMWNGKGKIVGVTDDFHNGHLREGIEPLIFMYSTSNGAYFYINIDRNAATAETLEHIEKTYKKYGADYPFEYTFLNDVFAREYRSEKIIGKLSLSFTVVAVVISCLGLLGLASFTAERRMKELGVRKVLGASAWNLVVLLCGDFTKLVLLALVLALPFCWYIASTYLSSYTFHAVLQVWHFLIPAGCLIILTALTVGYQSIRAALSNPVSSLRSE